MSLFETIQSDMYQAMKAGEKQKLITLRGLIAKLKDKKNCETRRSHRI